MLNLIRYYLLRFRYALIFGGTSLFLLRDSIGHGTFGLIYDWGFPLFSSDRSLSSLFSAWDPVNNGEVITHRTPFYFELLTSLAGKLHLPGYVTYQIAVFLAFTFMGYGLFVYLRGRKYGEAASAWAAIFYMTSVVGITRFAAGYSGYCVSMGFFPLLLHYYHRSVEAVDKKVIARSMVAAILISLFAFIQPQFIIFFLVYVIAEALLSQHFHRRDLFKRVISAGVVGGGWVVANLSWLYFSLAHAKQAFSDPLGSVAFISRLDSLPHALWNYLLLSDHANTNQVFTAVNADSMRIYLMFGILLVLLSLAIGNKNRLRFLTLILFVNIIFLPFALGQMPPFEAVYNKLMATIPGASLFREGYHIEYLLLLLYAVCLASAYETAHKWLKAHGNRAIIASSMAGLAFGIALFNLPVLTGDLFGYQGIVAIPPGSMEASNWARSHTDQRLFYPPGMNFWKLVSDQREGVNYPDQLALSFANQSVNQASSDLEPRNPSWSLRNATVESFMQKDQLFLSLLPFLGSDTIVDRSALVSNYWKSVEIQFQNPSVIKDWLAEPVSAKFHSYGQLRKEEPVRGFIFYSLPHSLGKVYAASSVSRICLFSDVTSSTRSFITDSSLPLKGYVSNACPDSRLQEIEDAGTSADLGTVSGLTHSASLGWSPGNLSFYEDMNFAQEIRPFLYTRVPASFSLALPSAQPDDRLMVRYYTSPYGGRLRLNGSELSTKSDKPQWRYAELPAVSEATVESIEGENAVSSLSILPSRVSPPQNKEPLPLADVKASYKQVTNTLYDASVGPATAQPKLIILSENYDPAWTLKAGKREYHSTMINSWANGFIIPGDVAGDVAIEYSGQSRYSFLVGISVLMVSGMMVFLWLGRRRS